MRMFVENLRYDGPELDTVINLLSRALVNATPKMDYTLRALGEKLGVSIQDRVSKSSEAGESEEDSFSDKARRRSYKPKVLHTQSSKSSKSREHIKHKDCEATKKLLRGMLLMMAELFG